MASPAQINPGAKLDYGLDAPRVAKGMFVRAAWTFGFGLILFLMNQKQYPGPATSLFVILFLVAAILAGIGWVMVWSSRVAKPGVRDRLINGLQLKGDERVLDVGCGRGLMAIGAAKKLKSGKVTGIDIWSPADLSRNTAEGARENAKIEGVADKVSIDTGDARKLSFKDASYDVVMSALTLHNIPDKTERDAAVREMWRVLKPGGKLVIFDISKTPEYAEVLGPLGAQDIVLSGASFLWCMKAQTLTARK